MQDNIKPWTIKNIPPEDRNAAITAAKRANMEIGEWMRRAIRTQIQTDRDQTRSPAVVGPTAVTVAPASLDPAVKDAASKGSSIDDIVRLIETAAKLKELLGEGKSLPRSVTSPATKLLRDQLRAAVAA